MEITLDRIQKPKKKRRRYNDPIFDNSYNKGEIEFQPFEPKIEINKQYVDNRLDDSYNAYDYYRKEVLHGEIDAIYNNSDWNKYYDTNKKIPKRDLTEVYLYIIKNLKDKSFTIIETFIEIADYLGIKYKLLYEMIPNAYKKNLLKELDKEYNNINKNKFLKLF